MTNAATAAPEKDDSIDEPLDSMAMTSFTDHPDFEKMVQNTHSAAFLAMSLGMHGTLDVSRTNLGAIPRV